MATAKKKPATKKATAKKKAPAKKTTTKKKKQSQPRAPQFRTGRCACPLVIQNKKPPRPIFYPNSLSFVFQSSIPFSWCLTIDASNPICFRLRFPASLWCFLFSAPLPRNHRPVSLQPGFITCPPKSRISRVAKYTEDHFKKFKGGDGDSR